MSKTVTVKVNLSATGVPPAAVSVSISDGVSPAQTVAAPYEATFAGVLAGTYTSTAQELDAAGAAIGAPVTSESFAVPEDIAAIESVTVTVQ